MSGSVPRSSGKVDVKNNRKIIDMVIRDMPVAMPLIRKIGGV